VPKFRLHFMDDPSRADLIDGSESEVVAAILAAHPGRRMELWHDAVLVRVFGDLPHTSFLGYRGGFAGPPKRPTATSGMSR